MKPAHVDVLMLRWILGLSILLFGGHAVASTPVRIAVAPFAGDTQVGDPMSIARSLAAELARHEPERLISPAEFIAEPDYEPRASEVRRWAFASAVDTVVVGQVLFEEEGPGSAPLVIETILRSGHSGAEVGRQQAVVPREQDLGEAIEKLAKSILEALGHPSELGQTVDGTSAKPGVVDGASADESGASTSAPSGSALDVAISKSKFKSDAPIEIKADEAEIMNRDNGRKLIFERNVWVRQDNVTLRSDRLEATYPKGESEPRELIAEGHVLIVQDDRRAKCDRAVYLRESNRLTCTGRAELVQGCDMIRGTSIEFDLAGEKARVEGAASIVIRSNGDESIACPEEREQL